jgi:hypothetical protein
VQTAAADAHTHRRGHVEARQLADDEAFGVEDVVHAVQPHKHGREAQTDPQCQRPCLPLRTSEQSKHQQLAAAATAAAAGNVGRTLHKIVDLEPLTEYVSELVKITTNISAMSAPTRETQESAGDDSRTA